MGFESLTIISVELIRPANQTNITNKKVKLNHVKRERYDQWRWVVAVFVLYKHSSKTTAHISIPDSINLETSATASGGMTSSASSPSSRLARVIILSIACKAAITQVTITGVHAFAVCLPVQYLLCAAECLAWQPSEQY